MTTSPIIACLSDPEVQEETRKRSKLQAVDWLYRRLSRLPASDGYARIRYGSSGSAANRGLRITFNATGAGVTAWPCKGKKEFMCMGVRSDSLAEALLGGYFAATLTDDPFNDKL